ncbi:type IV secretion system protein VirB10 [Acidovorax facilis]|jgi:type IV secretion system protein VirB10|uniref:type IV secretion system protein VirB10 n=1 Tax=Acidovorax facilis TaxID=12917 RepID=UPI003D652FE2
MEKQIQDNEDTTSPHAREKSDEVRARLAAADFDENAGLPSINRKTNANKLTTIAGFVFIIIIGVAAIVAVNKGPAEQPKRADESKLANRMPALEIPQLERPPAPSQVAGPSAEKEQAEDWMARKLGGKLVIAGGSSGASYAPGQGARSAAGGATTEEERIAQLMAMTQANTPSSPDAPAQNSLTAHLTPTRTQMVSASMLPNRNYVITKGATLDCALETAIDSSVPGMITCRLTRDVFSDNGKVLLLDRGSQLVGEYRSALKQGQPRMFVLWSRAKTPNGVIVSLDSPGTDALGRSGIGGNIDSHFWERFGSAILMSFVSDSVTAATRGGQNSGNSTNIYSNTANGGTKVVESMLEQSASIPPTLVVNQGAHVQVLVARDLDFSGVYALRAVQ